MDKKHYTKDVVTPLEPQRDPAHFDVLIIGAGLSGIGAAYHLQKHFPKKTYAVLEGRDQIGGTWDLFRYPGIRSDSDMFTLGYRFRPWRAAKAIADGPSILAYVNETAAEYGIDQHIKFNHWVKKLSWSSQEALWTVEVGHGDHVERFTCNFVWNCAGYYRYAKGYMPAFPNVDSYRGKLLHPQLWPEDLDYAGKKVVVIGSGATAVTLVPAMAEKTAHITMLQRSPSYVFGMPGTSALAKFLRRFLPAGWVYRLMRWQRIVLQQYAYKMARTRPQKTRTQLLDLMREKLGPEFDVDTHFSPTYNPWDQRLCLVPDDDLFEVLKSGDASIVTDHIETFTEQGVTLKSGKTLEADIIVSATGLTLEVLGGADVSVDGTPVNLADRFTYKGLMFEGVPNLVSVFGYTNASWTLRADLVSDYACRLLRHIDHHGFKTATPVNRDPDMPRQPFLDFSSGYVTRAHDILPKQGNAPWRHPQNFFSDLIRLRYGKIADGIMQFDHLATAEANAMPVAAE